MRAMRLQAEVVLGSRFDTIVEVAIVNGVQVHLHNLPLGVLLCQTIGQDGLLGFDLKRTWLIQEKFCFDQLLRDRTGAFDDSLALQICQSRAQDTLRVDPGICPESVILSSHCRIDKYWCDITIIYIAAPAIFGIIEFIEQATIAVIYMR